MEPWVARKRGMIRNYAFHASGVTAYLRAPGCCPRQLSMPMNNVGIEIGVYSEPVLQNPITLNPELSPRNYSVLRLDSVII